jgi:hypothetical protein
LGEQCVDQFWPTAKARRTQRGERRCEVNHVPSRRSVEQAESPCDQKSSCARGGDTGTVVHQDQIGLEMRGQLYRCSLAIMEPRERRVSGCGRRPDGELGGRRRDPVADDCRRLRVIQLGADLAWDRYVRE